MIRSLVLAVLVVLYAVSSSAQWTDTVEPRLSIYNDPGTGLWEVVARVDKIADCGLDPTILDTIDAAHTYPYAIIRYGKLCHEFYPAPPAAQEGEITATNSVTKTMGAAAIGRLVQMSSGLVNPLSETDRMDEWITGQTFHADATLADVLTMTAQSADITYSNREFEYDADGSVQVNRLADLMDAVIAEDPTHYGSPTDYKDFIDASLWTPLGMAESTWLGNGVAVGWRASVRDMARFGLLLMHNGVWDQKRILPSWWVHKMTHPVYEDANTGMGYLTWLAASRNYKIPGFVPFFPNPVSTCQPPPLWRSYPHTISGAPDCNYEGVYSCDITNDIGVFAANGGGGQTIVGHRGLDLVIVAKDKPTSDLLLPEWDIIKDALIEHDPVYPGDSASFCSAYAASTYAPDLVGHKYSPFIFALNFSPTSNWPDTEQRCDELGADCECSEPLDFTTTDTTTPIDPNTSTSKECWGQGSGGDTIGFSGSIPTTATTTEMLGSPYNFPALPTGTSIVQNILVDDVGGQLAVKDTYGTLVHDSTYCRRHYFVLHETMLIDYNGALVPPAPGADDDNDRVKMARAVTKTSSGTTLQHHESEFQGGSHPSGIDATFHAYENTIIASGAGWGEWTNKNWNSGLSLGTMRDHWWRMEHCWDHDASGTSDFLEHRVRLYGPLDSSPALHEAPVMTSGVSKSAGIELGDNSSNWIIDGFRQTDGRLLASGMWSGFTGATTRDGPYDPTFWIGCAEEVEGPGC